jgi:hypothetical protein
MPQHHLSCHCGAVQLDAELDLTNLAVCNWRVVTTKCILQHGLE